MNSKLHVLCNCDGYSVRLHLSEGQCSDFIGAEVLLGDLPPATALIGDKGYDSNKIRNLLAEQDIEPFTPARRNRNKPIPYGKRLYRMRHKVENLFARLKDWRRIATRYDRCSHIFHSAVLIAATVTFWL